ncbi:hypothetical protein [Pleionea litopenaei]|uniref:Uncharacterized protein n=1 Tax=Pleionea litopenaei TaxID=3070815 RepID=A0AA51RTG4_9GAMM|nr:hypothetical protein [Pleionea sp. HL-JVS1]WMS87285.1 hypothetical protein Q9312_18940 [Pleionea sp. HL-JVS1]
MFIVIASQIAEADSRTARNLFYVVLIANITTAVITIKALGVDHNTARLLSKSNDVSRQLAGSGIGGYGVIYANVVMLPILLLFLKKIYSSERISFLTITVFINVLVTLFMLIRAQYTIALAISFCVIGFIYFKRIIFNPYLLFTVTLTMLGIVSLTDVANDIYILVDLFEGTRYQAKIIDLIVASGGDGQETGAVSSRSDAYMLSLNSFFEYPVTGVLEFGSKIGHHSDILDKYAQWGFFLGSLVVYVLLYFPLKLYRLVRAEERIYIFCFGVALILVGLLNTLVMEVSIAFILLSIFYSIFYLVEKDKYEECSKATVC